MGAKDSKPSFITYEEAVKRVSDSELKRIREAFKRCAGANSITISLDAFIHEVLCDGVPKEVAEWLYQACGGTKRGIAFKELLCGLVVLTKGSIEEKIKFLWALYMGHTNENGTYLYKWDFARALHLENTDLLPSESIRIPELLTSLFGIHGERVGYDQFRSWILVHKDATVLSKWLLMERIMNLTSDLETPTFYQTLAGVTHLEERDVIELEKCFWSLRNTAPTGQLDLESLTPLLSPPLPRSAVEGTFRAFDENCDGHVDFKELCCGLSAACRGPRIERLKFCFKIFDRDRDGLLSGREVSDMIQILTQVANESLKNRQTSRASTPNQNGREWRERPPFDPDVIYDNLREKVSSLMKSSPKPVFKLGRTASETTESSSSVDEGHMKDQSFSDEESSLGDNQIDNSVVLSQEDFLIWSVECVDNLVSPMLDLIFQVCHIVLGLRPQCKHQESDIVLGWLWREVQRGYTVGQFWYLISCDWWSNWLAYTQQSNSGCAGDGCCRSSSISSGQVAAYKQIDEAIVCDESFTSNSTESMGSLLVETVSMGSASSSGVSSAIGSVKAQNPGPINNKKLLVPETYKVRTLTGEGGHLRRNVMLTQHRDFELVPDVLWRALAHWYGGPQPLPRQVIRPPNADVELELYPLNIRLYRHVQSTQPATAWTSPSERRLAYTAAFSRLATIKQVTHFLCGTLSLNKEDVRLWNVTGTTPVLLDDETLLLLELEENPRLLIEVRNSDQTWPEEIGALSSVGGVGGACGERRGTAPALPGATGLHNLGNTCFMNAALQAVWNTGPLTSYFNSGMHLYEVNTENPLSTKGALAVRYGELCKEVWSSRVRSVAPLGMRSAIGEWAPSLACGGQHDAQELLAWLLDALHEDLNRAKGPHPCQQVQSNTEVAQPLPDQVLAAEAWDLHTRRNSSIITDLFYGQLKSKVTCDVCSHESTRFDVFNMLSLPLPLEAYVHCQVKVILLNGSIPIKYGLRLNSESRYSNLKKPLSELCGLPTSRMLLVELSGSWITRVLDDTAKLKVPSCGELVVYETPAEVECIPDDSSQAEDWSATRSGSVTTNGGGEYDVTGAMNHREGCGSRRAQRSRSEILMSQSPPHTFFNNTYKTEVNYSKNSLPSEFRKVVKNSPTLSVRSLNIRDSPKKVKFGSSPSNMDKMNVQPSKLNPGCINFLVAVHRKQVRQDSYFLSSHKWRTCVFGQPLVVALYEGMSGAALYRQIWTQLSRLLTPQPPQEQNHATDCDDSLGYVFPFSVRVVKSNGSCVRCAWSKLCVGCVVTPTHTPFIYNVTPGAISRQKLGQLYAQCNECLDDNDDKDAGIQIEKSYTSTDNELPYLDLDEIREMYRRRGFNGTVSGLPPVMLAIDWEPTALHLRYQSTREKMYNEDVSVRESREASARPVGLGNCLEAFTAEEKLEQPYHCSKCKKASPATKKLQIWKLPPILVIHLKRFQYMNNKWMKSQKVVNFPFQDFDPTEYLASVPQETIHRHRELQARLTLTDESISESDDERTTEQVKDINKVSVNRSAASVNVVANKVRQRLQSTSLVTTPILDDDLIDYHKHNLNNAQNIFEIKYSLYAVVSHSGQLSGGHYVAYARNPNGTWLCFNDSSCRELPSNMDPPIDPSSAYLLFYERKGLDYSTYLPNITGKQPVLNETDFLMDDSDLKKMCVLS